jgi:hypothetical protein
MRKAFTCRRYPNQQQQQRLLEQQLEQTLLAVPSSAGRTA